MSEQPQANLKELLEANDLLDKAQQIDDSTYQLQWGSALVVVGIAGRALVIIAPLFHKLPDSNVLPFFRRLLELNSTLGGIAGFALQADGWVVLQSGRDTQGMDAAEFGALLTSVAEHADRLDDMLSDEFFPTEPSDLPDDTIDESAMPIGAEDDTGGDGTEAGDAAPDEAAQAPASEE